MSRPLRGSQAGVLPFAEMVFALFSLVGLTGHLAVVQNQWYWWGLGCSLGGNFAPGCRPILSRHPSFYKTTKNPGEISWVLKRTITENNGESTPKTTGNLFLCFTGLKQGEVKGVSLRWLWLVVFLFFPEGIGPRKEEKARVLLNCWFLAVRNLFAFFGFPGLYLSTSQLFNTLQWVKVKRHCV